ncbi:MAG: hypothetical protein A2Z18_01820 [Armatimonadetes bacterium RBG_16_58_9]|nr:MAG: hypothetical protein A2Z18_01820 [Armatimonadetes bacterium RBG_16_58_9]
MFRDLATAGLIALAQVEIPKHRNIVCLRGYMWDMPNIMRGDADTGERTCGNDYYQNMMLWALPAAI